MCFDLRTKCQVQNSDLETKQEGNLHVRPVKSVVSKF